MMGKLWSKLTEKENLFDNFLIFILCGFAFLLPLNEHINTWFLIVLVVLCVFQFWHHHLLAFLKENKWLFLIPALLLFVRLIGLIYAKDLGSAIQESQRSLSFLLIPFSFLVLSKTLPNCFRYVFSALTIGCVAAAAICWGDVISQIITDGDSLSALFTWKKSNTYLTEIIQIHPPYLGILVLTSVFYVFKRFIHKKPWEVKKYVAIVLEGIFILFLFHLVVRNSLLFLIISAGIYMLYFKKWKWLLLSAICLSATTFWIIEDGNHYLRRKYYKMLDFSNEKIGDQRFDRLEASWIVFKNHPLVGPGMGYDDSERHKGYVKIDDKRAIENNFNAHNQYIEYLSTFGLWGFLIFVFVLAFIMRRSILDREYFLTLLVCLFMFACLTESALERELGIKYFSLIIGLIMARTAQIKENND